MTHTYCSQKRSSTHVQHKREKKWRKLVAHGYRLFDNDDDDDDDDDDDGDEYDVDIELVYQTQ